VLAIANRGQPRWRRFASRLNHRVSQVRDLVALVSPDAPPATLAAPTPPAFAAAKTAAWHDRHAARDLYDLCALARLGLLDDAAGLVARFGPTGLAPQPWMFTDPPTSHSWTTKLGGQTRIAVGPVEASPWSATPERRHSKRAD
jgi:hypothetical protein